MDIPVTDPDVDEVSGVMIIPGVNDLPIFANAESKQLNQQRLKFQQSIEKLVNDINNMKERVKVMHEHFKNVQQEVDHTNSLHGAKEAEIKTEIHLRQLSSRALGKTQLDSKKIQGDIDFMKEQVNLLQNQIYKANERMDEFKMQMNWNQEELEQWAIAAKQKEEDYLAIEKYKRADEQKIKDLMLKVEHSTKELFQWKTKLENEVMDTQAKQMELDRIANEFKTAHEERQGMVNRWQDTILEMKKRDMEINDLGERFAFAKSERLKKEEQYNLQRHRLVAQQGENKDVEMRSEALSRIVLRKREQMMMEANKLNEFRGELESLKNELTTAAETLVSKRAFNQNQAQSIEERRVQLERERQKYQITKVKIEKMKNNNIAIEQKAKEAEDNLLDTEKKFNQEILRLKQLNEKAIKESQLVHELKTEEARLRSEITGARSISKNLESQLNQLDKEAARQQELLYNAEFQIQQIERKIARGMGERSDEEKQELKGNIAALEGQLDQWKEKRKILVQQNRKLQNELATFKTRKEELQTRFIKLTDQLGEKELENRMMEEEIKRDTRDLEEITVQNDLLLLEVKRLRDVLSAKSDVVFSLENRKQQLVLSMEERKQEIAVHRDLLRAELKALQDDKHRITVELNQRENNVQRLKARYAAASGPQEEGGEKHSQAYYVIKAAQKREELQRRGDQLDQDIRRSEKEIRALQITLEHLNLRNVAFRESFKKIDIQGEEADVLSQLEQRMKLSRDQLFQQKKDLQRITTDYEEDRARYESVQSQYDKIVKQQDHLEQARAQVEDEIKGQEGTLDDLAQRMMRSIERHHTRFTEYGGNLEKFPNGTLEEKTVKAEVLRDVVQLSQEFPEVSDVLASRLRDADLRLPTRPPVKSTANAASNTSGKVGSSSVSKQRTQGGSATPSSGPATNSSGAFVQPKTFGIKL
eukprot:scaffold4036_cov248-Ochromonas_danica.AAC.13